jgi:hypothetical protein
MLFTKRTWLIAGLLSLPGLALLTWWLCVQVYLGQLPPPRWDLPAFVEPAISRGGQQVSFSGLATDFWAVRFAGDVCGGCVA